MSQNLTRLPRVLLALTLLCGSPAAQEGRSLQDDDLTRFGESLAAYFAARTSSLGLDQARSELGASLEQLAGKLEDVTDPTGPTHHVWDAAGRMTSVACLWGVSTSAYWGREPAWVSRGFVAAAACWCP